jgi:uncharacterized protein YegP (UPF0339 family)
MARILIVCEGSDDRTALREYLTDLTTPSWPTGAALKRNKELSGKGRLERFEIGTHVLEVIEAEDKGRLAGRVLENAAPSTGAARDAVLVSFDPDDETGPAREFAFFEKQFKAAATKAGSQAALQREPDGTYRFKLQAHTIELLALPWRTPTNPGFDGLSDEQNLERVLIEGIVAGLAATPELEWATSAATSLRELASDHDWKRALRIWNAALVPKTAEHSFIANLFHDARTKASCRKAVESIGLTAHLERLMPIK